MADPWIVEAAKRDAEKKLEKAQAKVNITAEVAAFVAAANSKARTELQSAQQALGAITEQGLTDNIGPYSTLEQAMRAERFAGKNGAVEFVKANPECSEAEAIAAYEAAAITARPADRQYLVLSAASLLLEYRRNAVALGATQEDTWEDFRTFLVATPLETLINM
jgi:hypothetical protein